MVSTTKASGKTIKLMEKVVLSTPTVKCTKVISSMTEHMAKVLLCMRPALNMSETGKITWRMVKVPKHIPTEMSLLAYLKKAQNAVKVNSNGLMALDTSVNS